METLVSKSRSDRPDICQNTLTRAYLQALALPFRVLRDFLWEAWTLPHKTHVTPEHTPQLWQLVDTVRRMNLPTGVIRGSSLISRIGPVLALRSTSW